MRSYFCSFSSPRTWGGGSVMYISTPGSGEFVLFVLDWEIVKYSPRELWSKGGPVLQHAIFG